MATPQPSDILQRQNLAELLMYLRAAAVAHHRAQWVNAANLLISTLFAAAGAAAVFATQTASVITLLGALWAVVYTGFAAAWGTRVFRKAAVLQDCFDTTLFRLPWNSMVAGPEPTVEETHQLARRYRGPDDEILDYYEIPALPRPVDVLACQLQNLGWGSRIRRRFADTLLTGVVLWAAAGVIIGVCAGLTVSQILLRWFVPSLSLFLLGLNTYRAQLDVARARERAQRLLLERIREYAQRGRLASEHSGLLVLSRQVQDVLLSTRMASARVPNWYFRRFRGTDRSDFSAAMSELRRMIGAGSSPS
ncbi:S-4TM family putative pore-forming effector [Actinomadura formosensis]|uniref:S-4TM family putative pore-forming effector n=1 Tax=Actinomadura formosensis TaxID=60706 RepID=UPI0008339530|nr:S-4TM family putative pore-forming effector [Actinomadura formosensis]